MRLNEQTALLSSKILLVPYESHHVPTYHQWMEDPHLRAATASEMLSLEEEYNMQRSWRQEPDKLTFLAVTPPPIKGRDVIIAEVDDEPQHLVGDVNLFIFNGNDDEDDEEDEDEEEDDEGDSENIPHELPFTGSASSRRQITGEVEIMIGHQRNQGKGYGRAMLLLFLAYVLRHRDAIVSGIKHPKHLPPCPDPPVLANLRVKIGQSNTRSLRLFESVGFRKKTGKPNYFGEYEMCVQMPMEDYRIYVDELLEANGQGDWKEMCYVHK